jgi:hypothetical protein
MGKYSIFTKNYKKHTNAVGEGMHRLNVTKGGTYPYHLASFPCAYSMLWIEWMKKTYVTVCFIM